MQAIPGHIVRGNTQFTEHVAGALGGPVVLADMCNDRATLPLRRELLGNRRLPTLISTAVPDEDDVLEAVHLEAVGHVGEHRLEGLLPEAERSRASHVPALRLDAALGNQLHDRGTQGIPEPACNRVAVSAQHVVVLARHEPRAVGLDATGRNDGRRLACGERIADVHPRHLLDPHGVCRGQGIRGVRTVVLVLTAVPTAHGARVGGRSLSTTPRDLRLCARCGRQRPLVRDRFLDRGSSAPRPEVDDLPRPLERLHAVSKRDTVDARQARCAALVVPHRGRIGDHHVQRDDGVVVQVVPLPAHQALPLHVTSDAPVVVVLLYVRHHGAGPPLGVQRLGHGSLTTLVPTAVADEDDVPEAVHLQAVRHVREHRLEGLLAKAQSAWAGHVPTLRLDGAFRHQLDDRRADRVSELPRDRLAVGPQDVVVLARDEPWTVRLDAPGRDDGRRLAGG